MYTINYNHFQALRKDPVLYWNTTKADDRRANVNTLLELVKRTIKNPNTVSDYFVIPPDVSGEDPKGVKRQDIFASMILNYLDEHDEVPEETQDYIINRANAEAELPKNYIPTHALVKYGEYLLIKDERFEMEPGLERKAEYYVTRIRQTLPCEGVEIDKDELKDPVITHPNIQGTVKRPGPLEVYLMLDPQIRIGLEVNDVIKDKKNFLFLQGTADYIMYNTGNKSARVVYFHICERVTDFPEKYIKEGLDRFVGFQRLVLEKIFEKFTVEFMVFDSERMFTFPIKEYVNLKEELEKAYYTLSTKSIYPYEYDKKEIIL